MAIGGENDKIAYRGDFAAEAEVVKLRRNEAMVGALWGQVGQLGSKTRTALLMTVTKTRLSRVTRKVTVK